MIRFRQQHQQVSGIVSQLCLEHVSHTRSFAFLVVCLTLAPGDVLDQLVTPHGVSSLPNIVQLLSESFFKDVELGQVEKGSFKVCARADMCYNSCSSGHILTCSLKVSARVKEAVATARKAAHQAMRQQQAQVEQLRRQDEAQREEDKRRKQREREQSRQVWLVRKLNLCLTRM